MNDEPLPIEANSDDADLKAVKGANNAIQEAERIMRRLRLESRKNNRPDKYLYHYTTAAGLQGIVQTNSLWATNLSYMNDAQELTYGTSLFSEYCSSRLKTAKSWNEAAILDTAIQLLGKRTVSDVYACCFTVKDDQLSQWRGYAPETVGYSIGFDISELRQYIDKYGSHREMIYNTDDQFELIKQSVSVFFQQSFGENPRLQAPLLTTVAETFKVVVDYLSACFKHRGFQEEAEERILIREEQARDAIKLRLKNGILIPYMELHLKNAARLPIARVKVGPNIYPEIAAHGVETLLKNAGHTVTVVSNSDIPLRAF